MKRAISAVLASVTMLACAGTEGLSGSSSAFDAPAPTSQVATAARSELEKDLVLTLRRTSTDAFEIDRNPRFEVVLKNTSNTKAHAIVLPSDGSESNWREPHVFYTVERRDSPTSPWVAAPAERMLRCGNYDRDWTKDVVDLAPGKEVVLPWFDYHPQWNLEGASDVRVTAHYAYGDHAKDLRKVPPALHATPAYAVTSNAMELAIDPALTLDLTWKGVMPKRGELLSKSVDVVAVSHARGPIPFAAADTGANLRIEIEGRMPDGSTEVHSVASSISVEDAKDRIAPASRKSVVGAARSQDDLDLPAGFRPTRARARLHVWWYIDEANGTSDERTARSPWVPIP